MKTSTNATNLITNHSYAFYPEIFTLFGDFNYGIIKEMQLFP